MPIAVDRSKGLELYQASLKPGEVLCPKQLAFESGGGNLKGVFGPWDQILHVEHCAEILREHYAVVVGHTGEPLYRNALRQFFRAACFYQLSQLCPLSCILFQKDP